MIIEGKEDPSRSDVPNPMKGRRSSRFVIRMSTAERQLFEQAARQVGLTLSSFVRSLLVRAVNRLRKRRDNAENESAPASPGDAK